MNKPKPGNIVVELTYDDIIEIMSMFAASVMVYGMIDAETSEKYDKLFDEVKSSISELDNEADIDMRLAEILKNNEELYLNEAKTAFPMLTTLCKVRKERRRSNESE